MKIKVKVLIPFCDKHTGKKYKAGDVLEVTAERFNEITVKGKYIKPVEDEKPAKAQ